MKPSVYECSMCGSENCPIRVCNELKKDEAVILIEATGDVDHLTKILDTVKPLIEDHPKVISANIQLYQRDKVTKKEDRKQRSGPRIIALGRIGADDDLPDEVKDFLKMFMGALGGGPEELEMLDLDEEPDAEAEEEKLEDMR